MRKYLDPAKMTIVKAGDFAKGGGRGSGGQAMRPSSPLSQQFCWRCLPAGADARRRSRAARPRKKVPHMQTLHGDTLKDDYFWLREKENPEVRAYLEAENAYTDAFMKPTEALPEDALRRDARPHQGDRPLRPYRDGG